MSKNSMVLYGKNSIFERLKKNPASIRKLFLQDNLDLSPDLERLIKVNHIATERLSSQQLARIKRAKGLQGIVAKVDRFEYVSFDDLLHQPKPERLTLLFLDRLSDPQNLGAVIRTAACFGGFAVVIPRFEACQVNETVLHVASGGENYVPVSMVSSLAHALVKVKKCEYWTMGACVSDEAGDISKISLPFPLALVLGSEGKGIRYGLQRHLDLKARIPMPGAKLSFNVSMACAIFCHEIAKQRGVSG